MKAQNTTIFSDQDFAKLKKRLDDLRAACFPHQQLIKPRIRFSFSSDFEPQDVLKWGDGFYYLQPSELKSIWEDRQTLRDSHVDYICVNNQKWFFNTNDILGKFFLQDGSRKVEIQFPFWMDMQHIMKAPGTRTAIFDILKKCMGSTFPTEEEAQKSFSKEISKQMYYKNPSRETLEFAVLEMIETLRPLLMDHLKQNYANTIAASQRFKRYVKSRTFPVNTPQSQQVREFLDTQKQQIYAFTQQFGLMKGAAKLFRYEPVRDHASHSERIPEPSLKPEQIYKDFCIALGQPIHTDSNAKSLSRFGRNTEIVHNLNTLSRVWDILDKYVDPKLKKKKNKEDYYNDLISKQLLNPDEVDILRGIRLERNAVAHVNGFVKNARSKVADNPLLEELAFNIFNRDRVLSEKNKER